MDKIKLGKKIKEARERLNYTQETLISELNPRISLKTLQRAEKGSEEVSSETLMIITEFLSIEFKNVSISEVFCSKKELSLFLSI